MAPDPAVRSLVRRLPWAQWAAARGTGWRLNQRDADLIAAAIETGIKSSGITLEQAAEIALVALGEAKTTPARYVSDAFRKHLPARLRALSYEPLADDPLPLVGTPEPIKPAMLPACATCGAREGEGLAYRRVTGSNDRARRCPDCAPLAVTTAS